MDSNSEKPVDRRRFFRLGLSELLRPLASAAKPLERMAHELGKLDQPRVRPEVWLRPPGSLPEARFLQTCQRTGDCVAACPVKAIKLDSTKAGGAPYIDADSSACVVCTGLKCMSVCPSGALRSDIDQRHRHGNSRLECVQLSAYRRRILHDLHRQMPTGIGRHRVEIRPGGRESAGLHRLRRLSARMSDIAEEHCRYPGCGEDGVSRAMMTRRMISRGAGFPVHVSNCAAAWRTNISTPPIIFAPHASA